jgi:hypothetical protein
MAAIDRFNHRYRAMEPDIVAMDQLPSEFETAAAAAQLADGVLAAVAPGALEGRAAKEVEAVAQTAKIAREAEAAAQAAREAEAAAQAARVAREAEAAAQAARIAKEAEAAKAARAAKKGASAVDPFAKDPGYPMRDKRWGERMYDSQPPLDSPSKWAINEYTGTKYTDINGALRGGSGKFAEEVAAIDRAMAPITEPVTVFRSAPIRALGEGAADPAALVGKSLKDPGFMSTSLSDLGGGKFVGQVRFEIECPPGTMGRYVGRLSSVAAEEEVLLARNTQLQVQSATLSPPGYPPGVWVMKCRVVR